MRRSVLTLCERTLANGTKLNGTFSPLTSHLVNGVATMPDGRVYKGLFDETHGFPTGQGQLEEDGDLYRGAFNSMWQRHGAGEAWLADGTTYKGQFENDDFVKGTVNIPNGSHETTFVGTLRDEMFVEGTLSQHDFTYTGEFQNNTPHGKGKITFATGAEQSGLFSRGKLHGPDCTMKLEGGFVYAGEFMDGVIRRGTLYTPTYTYEGEFNEHGRAHGEGSQFMLATSPRLTFTGIWTHGQLSQGSCVDEHGTPVDWRNSMEAQKAAADGDEVALAATHYCRAKLKEGTALSKELEASFREDKKRMSQDTGKTPTMYDLGYEHGMTAGREALFGEVSRMTEGGKSREAAMACHAAVRKETVASAVRGSSVELHEGKAGLGIYDQISAQQLLAERLDEQHQRFLRTTVDKAPVQAGVHSLSRKGLNIEGNAPWMSMTPKA